MTQSQHKPEPNYLVGTTQVIIQILREILAAIQELKK